MSEDFENIVKRENAGLRATIDGIFASLPEDSPESQALKKSLLKLLEYNASLAKAIDEQFRASEEKATGKWPEIYTVCAPTSMARELGNRGFEPVSGMEATCHPQTSLHAANVNPAIRPIAFLHCRLDDVEGFCHRKYRGKQGNIRFSYKFAPTYCMIAREKILLEFASLYRIEKPLIFSPWARRAVFVDYQDDFIPEAGENIDLQLAENDLGGVLLPKWGLYWNLHLEKLKNSSGINARPTPEHPYYTTLYNEAITKNTFVLPVDLENISPDLLSASRDNNGIRIESPEKCGELYYRLDIHPVDLEGAPEELKFFSNHCDLPVIEEAQRLRTAGEINRLLHAIETSCYVARYLNDQSGQPLVPYSSRQKYPANVNETIFANFKNRPEIRVGFSTLDDTSISRIFVDDYGNYVLSYLRERFPEYAWKGFFETEREVRS